jgi:protein O-GlcNAc transferase
VLRIDPLAADSLVNRGNTYKEIGRVNEAIQDYLRAIATRPTMAEAHANLASAYKDSGLVEAAVKSYRQALVLRPDFPEATCNLLHTLQCVCSWEGRDKLFTEVEAIIRRQIDMSLLPSVQPFHAIAYPIDPMLALEISCKYAAQCSIVASRFALPTFNHPTPIPVKCDGGNSRLRVGYVSSDFGNHPLSHLMGSVFGMHDRQNVEVFCYALSQNDGTEWRQRILSEAEHFLDVSSMSSDMIAKMINEDKIQILINLNGYTKGARNEIFAMQPAPIQVSYMGFPGTTGASYIHYLVTDEFVSPLHLSHIYSEKLVHLPHCYFVNDYQQVSFLAYYVRERFCNFFPCYLNLFCPAYRKIRMCWNQTVCTSDLIMVCRRTNSFLHASISCIRWTLKYSVHGAIFLNVYRTVLYGYSDSQLLVK